MAGVKIEHRQVKKGKKEEPPVQVTFTHPSTQPARNRVAANHYRMLWNGWCEYEIDGHAAPWTRIHLEISSATLPSPHQRRAGRPLAMNPSCARRLALPPSGIGRLSEWISASAGIQISGLPAPEPHYYGPRAEEAIRQH